MSLVVTGVSKVLGGHKVLDGLGFSATGGERIALFGENGAGKSTLLRILAGVLDADLGEATLFGTSLLAVRTSARKQVGYVPEAADAPSHLSPKELASLVAALKQAEPPTQSEIERLGVLPYWNRPIGSLSLGQRRRSCLLAALVGSVRLLLLDEPTNGLDPGGVHDLAEILRAQSEIGTMMVVATHDHAFARMLEAREIRLVSGRIVG